MNDIEQQFFKTFGIEKQDRCKYCNFENKPCRINDKRIDCVFWRTNPEIYPEITAEKLLKLVCVSNKFKGYTSLLNDEYSEIKEEILRDILFAHEQLKLHKADLSKQVRSLFEEGE